MSLRYGESAVLAPSLGTTPSVSHPLIYHPNDLNGWAHFDSAWGKIQTTGAVSSITRECLRSVAVSKR